MEGQKIGTKINDVSGKFSYSSNIYKKISNLKNNDKDVGGFSFNADDFRNRVEWMVRNIETNKCDFYEIGNEYVYGLNEADKAGKKPIDENKNVLIELVRETITPQNIPKEWKSLPCRQEPNENYYGNDSKKELGENKTIEGPWHSSLILNPFRQSYSDGWDSNGPFIDTTKTSSEQIRSDFICKAEGCGKMCFEKISWGDCKQKKHKSIGKPHSLQPINTWKNFYEDKPDYCSCEYREWKIEGLNECGSTDKNGNPSIGKRNKQFDISGETKEIKYSGDEYEKQEWPNSATSVYCTYKKGSESLQNIFNYVEFNVIELKNEFVTNGVSKETFYDIKGCENLANSHPGWEWKNSDDSTDKPYGCIKYNSSIEFNSKGKGECSSQYQCVDKKVSNDSFLPVGFQIQPAPNAVDSSSDNEWKKYWPNKVRVVASDTIDGIKQPEWGFRDSENKYKNNQQVIKIDKPNDKDEIITYLFHPDIRQKWKGRDWFRIYFQEGSSGYTAVRINLLYGIPGLSIEQNKKSVNCTNVE